MDEITGIDDNPMLPRIIVRLTDAERAALQRLCNLEVRDPREQAHKLIRDGLERAGLLRSEPTKQNREKRASRKVKP